MNSQQLFYFVTVAQTRSIRQAAHLCQISPAAISLTLQNLSSEMKVPLYAKTSTSIELTEEGLLFYDAAVSLLAILEDSRRHFRITPLNLSGNIQIAAVGGIAPFILSFALMELSLTFPDLSYKVHTMTLETILRQVASRQINIGYFNSMPNEAANYRREYPNLTFEPLVLCDFVLLANKNHPLAPKRQLNSQDLKTYPTILYVHDDYQDNPLFAAFAQHTSQKIYFTKNTNYLTHMVMDCDYLTLTPYMNNKLSAHFFDIRSHVLFFPKKPIQYSTYCVYADTVPQQNLLQDFIAYTRFFYHSQ